METASHLLICRYMDQLIEDLRRLVPQVTRRWDAQHIHAARVITRRLKAALDLVNPLLGEKYRRPFAKALKTLRRRLGPLRDLDVMITHLGEFTANRKHALAIAWLTERLGEDRQARRRKTARKTLPAPLLARLGNWWSLRNQIEESDQKIDELLARSLHEQLGAFAEQATRLKGVPETTLAAGQSEDPHSLRIAGKLLRYTLELADVAGHTLPKSVFKTFKRMQQALGMWHDYVVLSQTVLHYAAGAEVAAHRRILYEQLIDLARTFWRRAERQLNTFSKLWDEEGDRITAAIRDAIAPPHEPAPPPPLQTAEVAAPPPLPPEPLGNSN